MPGLSLPDQVCEPPNGKGYLLARFRESVSLTHHVSQSILHSVLYPELFPHPRPAVASGHSGPQKAKHVPNRNQPSQFSNRAKISGQGRLDSVDLLGCNRPLITSNCLHNCDCDQAYSSAITTAGSDPAAGLPQIDRGTSASLGQRVFARNGPRTLLGRTLPRAAPAHTEAITEPVAPPHCPM